MSASPATARLASHFEHALAGALESMTGRRFSISREQAEPDVFGDSLVWRQPLTAVSGAGIWLVAPRPLWTMTGRVTLEFAGVETATEEDCRSTWFEICAQTIATVAGGISADTGRGITTGRGAEDSFPLVQNDWIVFAIRDREENVFYLRAGWSADISALYDRAPGAESKATNDSPPPKTLDILLDVALPVSISFGKTSLQIREVLKLNTGSIVELNRFVSDPVDVIVNDCVIARGEVVVVDGNYGVRITHLASREDRLRSGMREVNNRPGGNA